MNGINNTKIIGKKKKKISVASSTYVRVSFVFHARYSNAIRLLCVCVLRAKMWGEGSRKDNKAIAISPSPSGSRTDYCVWHHAHGTPYIWRQPEAMNEYYYASVSTVLWAKPKIYRMHRIAYRTRAVRFTEGRFLLLLPKTVRHADVDAALRSMFMFGAILYTVRVLRSSKY